MRRFQEKLLAIVLVLLLGLSPLQNVLADLAYSFTQEGAVSMVDCMHGGDMAMAADQSTHDCKYCDIDQGCASHACSSSDCTSAGIALVSTYSYPTARTVASKVILVKTGFESQNPSSLLRPPIA